MENLENLFEVFDTKSDNLYPIVNMKPGSSTPQIFLIKNGGDENLIVRLMALSDKGDTVRVLKSTDKNVIVEVMAINDRGRHVVLKNGLGPDAIKTIVTVFDTTLDVLNLQIVNSIMFRFQTNKLKGQSKSVSRILEKLCMTRGKGKFIPLKEMKQFTNKFSYVVLHKKRLDIDELPGAKNISDKYEKSGDNFTDKSGKEVSKSEVVADAISTSVEKIKHEQIAQKTKIDKQVLLNALYGQISGNVENWSENAQEAFQKCNESTSIYKGQNTEENEEFNKTIKRKLLDETDFSHRSVLKTIVDDGDISNKKLAMKIKDDLMEKIKESSNENMQEKLDEMIDILKKNKVANIGAIIKSCYFVIASKFSDILAHNTFDYDFTDEERNAVNNYTDTHYGEINSFLIGIANSVNSYTFNNHVKLLDSAFKKGVTLPKQTSVYRGMLLRKEEAEQMLKHKMFVFKNYVSTSFVPVIFTGMFGDAGKAYFDNKDELDKEEYEYRVGFIINGLDKIKSIVPGRISEHPKECEVILPRGLMIKLNEVITNKTSILCKCEVVLDDSINESIDYEENKLSFKSVFYEKQKSNMDILMSMFNDSEVSDKFMM